MDKIVMRESTRDMMHSEIVSEPVWDRPAIRTMINDMSRDPALNPTWSSPPSSNPKDGLGVHNTSPLVRPPYLI